MRNSKLYAISIVLVLVLACITVSAYGKPIQAGDSFPDIKLPVPKDQSDRKYLGLSNEGTFKIKDIRADVVIIEIFNSG